MTEQQQKKEYQTKNMLSPVLVLAWAKKTEARKKQGLPIPMFLKVGTGSRTMQRRYNLTVLYTRLLLKSRS
jgi:hypothetical protein